MCYFVKMSLSQVSCAVFARGLRALSMRLRRATGAQDHPKASSCFQCSAAEAGGDTHTHTQPAVEGAREVPLLVSASASAATRAGSAGGWALWESPCVMQERGCLPGGRKVCLEREGALLEGVKSFPGSGRRDGFDGRAGLSPSHLLALLQKKESGEREVSLRC